MYFKLHKCNLSLFGATLIPELYYFLLLLFLLSFIVSTSSELVIKAATETATKNNT